MIRDIVPVGKLYQEIAMQSGLRWSCANTIRHYQSPILTYELRGCTKRGVKPKHHGIAYDTRKKPRAVAGEPELGFAPIGIEVDNLGESLAIESRVNYSKLVTVEHNVEVHFLGHVVERDFEKIVRPAVDKCWSRKVLRTSNSSRLSGRRQGAHTRSNE